MRAASLLLDSVMASFKRITGSVGALVIPPFFLAATSCSLKKRAVDTMADVFQEAELVYLSDEDPELIGAALPFNLKTIETLLASSPGNRNLLVAATKTFMLYAYGFVEPAADTLESTDFESAEAIRERAFRLYMRAYRYGLRALELGHGGISERLSREPEKVALELGKRDVPAAVWTAAALGGAIGVAKDNPEVTADIAVVGALLERARVLEPDFESGTIPQFLMLYEAQRVGGSKESARAHYQRALELGPAKRCSVWLSWAESISVPEQDREEFLRLIDQVLAFDVNAFPQSRLLNILAQRRARWLKGRVEELFLEGDID